MRFIEVRSWHSFSHCSNLLLICSDSFASGTSETHKLRDRERDAVGADYKNRHMSQLQQQNIALAKENELLIFQNRVLKAMCTISTCSLSVLTQCRLLACFSSVVFLFSASGLTKILVCFMYGFTGESDYRALCAEAGIENTKSN